MAVEAAALVASQRGLLEAITLVVSSMIVAITVPAFTSRTTKSMYICVASFLTSRWTLRQSRRTPLKRCHSPIAVMMFPQPPSVTIGNEGAPGG